MRALLAHGPNSVPGAQTQHEHATAYARIVPDVVRLTASPGTRTEAAKSAYELEWVGGAGQAPLVHMVLDCWQSFSVGRALDAKQTQDPDLVYPGMPLLVYGRLRPGGKAEGQPPAHLYDEERSGRKIALAGIGDLGLDWPLNLRKQRVFALGIVNRLSPFNIDVAALTF
jgi:hypothetical protein